MFYSRRNTTSWPASKHWSIWSITTPTHTVWTNTSTGCQAGEIGILFLYYKNSVLLILICVFRYNEQNEWVKVNSVKISFQEKLQFLKKEYDFILLFFFCNRKDIHKFYPEFMRKPKSTKFFKFGRNDGGEPLEVRVERAHRQISEANKSLDIKKALSGLYRKYLEVCWEYAFYG